MTDVHILALDLAKRSWTPATTMVSPRRRVRLING